VPIAVTIGELMSAIKTETCKPDIRRIVSVDGEGIERGRHAYTLLAAADDRGFRAYIEHDGTRREAARYPGERHGKSKYHPCDTAANYGLPTKRIFDFLLGIPESPADLVISFSFNYDVTKVIQDLPYSALKEFAELGCTIWEGYLISGIPRKYLQIEIAGRRVRIWDTFAYWQMSFAKALDSSPELFDAAQQEIISFIARMKRERANFDMMPDDEIREYCFNECEFLAVMYRDFLRNLDSMGLTQLAHSGPGSAANAFFGNVDLKSYMPTGDPTMYLAGLPVDVATFSYYGGRFEIAVQGLVGDQYEYDLQSAYPSIAVTLPCLKHGRFRETSCYEPGKLGFYYVGSRTSGPWAPFPFRATAETGREYLNRASKGAIAFVHGGRRWVTSHEVEVARKYFGADAIPVFSGWVFDAGCNHKPFADLLALYLRRKIGDPMCPVCLADSKHFCPDHPSPSAGLSKVIKLIINSVYGKLAQAIGWDSDPKIPFLAPKAPEYQCYIWASWITGGTRAKVLEAALIGGREDDCPDCGPRACAEHSSVVSIATDGILSSKPIPELYVTDWELGTWEKSAKPDTWLGMPGIYSFRDNGKPDSCEECRTAGAACPEHASAKKFKRRGLDSRYFPAAYLRAAWERGAWSVGPIGERDCPDCQRRIKGKAAGEACEAHPMRGFMPYKLAMQRTNALEEYGEWIGMIKRIKFASVEHKRNYAETPADDFLMPHGRTIRLETITIPDDIRSAPYTPKQTWADVLAGRIDDPDIPMWADSDDTPEFSESAEMSLI
jgi:hypothetical protein